MIAVSYWTKGCGRGGEVEEFDSFADAEEYYHEMGKILDSEDMVILRTDDGVIVEAKEFEYGSWWDAAGYIGLNIEDI